MVESTSHIEDTLPDLRSDRARITLRSALKRGIEEAFQLEEGELVAERIGTGEHQAILLYEASEGSAGVPRRLIEEADVFAQVAHSALALCHFDEAGSDLKPAAMLRATSACSVLTSGRGVAAGSPLPGCARGRRPLPARRCAEAHHQPSRVLPSASRAPQVASCPVRLADGFYASPSIAHRRSTLRLSLGKPLR